MFTGAVSGEIVTRSKSISSDHVVRFAQEAQHCTHSKRVVCSSSVTYPICACVARQGVTTEQFSAPEWIIIRQVKLGIGQVCKAQICYAAHCDEGVGIPKDALPLAVEVLLCGVI